MPEPRTKYRISLTRANGHTHVFEGEARSFVFACEGEREEEKAAYIGTDREHATILVATLFTSLEKIAPQHAAALLDALNQGVRSSVGEPLVPGE